MLYLKSSLLYTLALVLLLISSSSLAMAQLTKPDKPILQQDTSTLLLAEGDAVPDGRVFSNFAAFALNDEHSIAFLAEMKNNSNGTTQEVSNGLFLMAGGTMNKIALQGDNAPGGGRFASLILSTDTPQDTIDLNNRGEVAFLALIEDKTPRVGIFLFSSNGLTPLLLTGSAAPGGGIFVGFNSLAINDNGTIAFSGYLSGSNTDNGIFMLRQGKIERVIGAGDTLANGQRLDFLRLNANSLNNQDQLAIFAILSTSTRQTGIFLVSGKNIASAVLTGQAAPIGGNIEDLGLPVINDQGTIVCSATIKGKTGNMLLRISGQEITKVVAIGDPTPQGEKITTVNAFRNAYAINNSGSIAYSVLLENSAQNAFFITKDGLTTEINRNIPLPQPQFPNQLRFYPLSLNNKDTVLLSVASFDTIGFVTTIKTIHVGLSGNFSSLMLRKVNPQ